MKKLKTLSVILLFCSCMQRGQDIRVDPAKLQELSAAICNKDNPGNFTHQDMVDGGMMVSLETKDFHYEVRQTQNSLQFFRVNKDRCGKLIKDSTVTWFDPRMSGIVDLAYKRDDVSDSNWYYSAATFEPPSKDDVGEKYYPYWQRIYDSTVTILINHIRSSTQKTL